MRSNGHRTYSNVHRERLTFIRRSRDFGFSIEQIRQLIDLGGDGGRDCVEARDLARSHLEAVRLKMAELRALESGLAALVQSCSDRCMGGPPSGCTIFSDLTSQPVALSTAGCCCS
ncbi:MerR family DNA-binding protein [Aquabacterium sp. CECT 9606]|uniref:MerR family DNA-binding protein n=1 Tax=Aquabacterium sp. CECT 9606 TaxID=2845822 RepID=UPI00352FFC30